MKQKHNRKRRGLLWISIGLLLIAAAIFLASYNLYDEQRAAKTAGEALDRLEEAMPVEASAKPAPDAPAVAEANPTLLPRDEQIELPDYILFPHMEMPVESIDGNDFIGVLQIPALDLELPVISEWSYPNLRIAPCRFSGSAYLDDMVICGHNYSAHFGKLKKLRESGHVEMDENGLLTLTPAGEAIAQRIYERHKVLTVMLTSLGVEEPIAAKEACKIEHDISVETFEKIKQHLKDNGVLD